MREHDTPTPTHTNPIDVMRTSEYILFRRSGFFKFSVSSDVNANGDLLTVCSRFWSFFFIEKIFVKTKSDDSANRIFFQSLGVGIK